MMNKPTMAARFGQKYADEHAAHFAAVEVIDQFSDRHPWGSPGNHRLRREGDTLSCIPCGVSVHAPVPPPRPMTPMEASMSPFD